MRSDYSDYSCKVAMQHVYWCMCRLPVDVLRHGGVATGKLGEELLHLLLPQPDLPSTGGFTLWDLSVDFAPAVGWKMGGFAQRWKDTEISTEVCGWTYFLGCLQVGTPSNSSLVCLSDGCQCHLESRCVLTESSTQVVIVANTFRCSRFCLVLSAL